MKTPSTLSIKFYLVLIITTLSWMVGMVHSTSAQVPIPPTFPANGEIYPWGYKIKGTAWNTSQYLPFVYNRIPFRMLIPPGVTYNRTTNTFTNVNGEKFPVIFFLHGSNLPGSDNGYQLSVGGKEFLEAFNSGRFRGIVIFPQNFTSFWGSSQQVVLGILNRLIAKNLADPFAISITGTSSGGSGTWDLLALNPAVFASCAPMSATTTLATSSISKYVHVPIWLAQGAYDGIAKPSKANTLVTSIQNAGGNIKYAYYSDIGHGTWDKFLLEPDLFPFFSRANKVNPHVFFGRTDFYPADAINIKLGVTAGFEAYEWRRNGIPVSGATTNGITVTQIGTYDVRIKRSGQWSYWSPVPVVVRIIPTTVAPPNGLTLRSATPTSVVLNWKDNALNETAYEIYRSGNGTTFSKIATTNANTTSYTDNVNSKTSYYYKILATNTYGASSFSNTLLVTTPNTNPVISALPIATAIQGTSSSLAVTATDTDDSSVTFGLLNNPPFISIVRTATKAATLTIASSNSKGIYPVSITATDASGGHSIRNVTITIHDVAIISTYINFNNGANAPLPWNNIAGSPTLNLTRTNLKDDKNVATGINLTLLTAWQGASMTGTTTGNNSGIFSDDVMRTSYYEGGASTKQIRFSGLSTTRLYNFIFFGSRSGTGDRTTLYTAGGQTVTMNTSGNTGQTVQINGVKPSAAGEIVVQVKKGTNANFSDLNAMIIQSYLDSGMPEAPSELAVATFAKNSLALQWKDNSSSESGFEIWRSETNAANTFTRIATTAANATTFSNTNLQSDKVYHYKVRAIVAGGAILSPFSNTISVSTLAYTISLNFNSFVGAPSPWNNLNDGLSIDSPPFNFRDDQGHSTGISLSVLDNFNGTNTSGMNTGNNSGVYPDAVMRGFNYLETGASAKLLITGLNPQNVYHFNFVGSRQGTGDKTGRYTIGNKSVFLNSSNNISEVAQINNVIPQEDGSVLIDIYAPTTSDYAYINAMVIQAFSIPPATQNAAGREQITIAKTQKENTAEQTEEAKLVAFPNPFNDKITLIFPQEIEGKIYLELYEASGRRVKEIQIDMNNSATKEIDLTDIYLNLGLHLLKVANSEGKVETIKMIRR